MRSCVIFLFVSWKKLNYSLNLNAIVLYFTGEPHGWYLTLENLINGFIKDVIFRHVQNHCLEKFYMFLRNLQKSITRLVSYITGTEIQKSLSIYNSWNVQVLWEFMVGTWQYKSWMVRTMIFVEKFGILCPWKGQVLFYYYIDNGNSPTCLTKMHVFWNPRRLVHSDIFW